MNADIDGDHRFEAFVCGNGFPNLVYQHDAASGTLRDVLQEQSGSVQRSGDLTILAAPERKAIGVAACDMDGDGAEEIYVLNTDAYGGDKGFGDHIFHRDTASDTWTDIFADAANAGVRNSFAGRSVACVDRTGGGRYGVAAASYSRPLLLYEMTDAATGTIRDVARAAGFVGVTGGRGITGGPLYPGKDYASTPGMDVYMDNERGPSFFFRNDGHGRFVESARSLGLEDAANNGRGVALLDANADGRIDIVTGNWMGPHRLWLAPSPGARGLMTTGRSSVRSIRPVSCSAMCALRTYGLDGAYQSRSLPSAI